MRIESPGSASEKKVPFIKRQTIKISLNKNPLSKEKKNTSKDLVLVYNKNSKKCNIVFATSLIEVGVPLQNLKVYFGFLCLY